jgi:hypothetical protein
MPKIASGYLITSHYPYFGIGTQAEKPALEMAFSCTQTFLNDKY